MFIIIVIIIISCFTARQHKIGYLVPL